MTEHVKTKLNIIKHRLTALNILQYFPLILYHQYGLMLSIIRNKEKRQMVRKPEKDRLEPNLPALRISHASHQALIKLAQQHIRTLQDQARYCLQIGIEIELEGGMKPFYEKRIQEIVKKAIEEYIKSHNAEQIKAHR